MPFRIGSLLSNALPGVRWGGDLDHASRVPTRHLQSDTEIRDWASAHSAADVTPLPSGENVRLLNRLLNGWVTDDVVAGFEKICSGITAARERKSVQDQVGRRKNDLHNKQAGGPRPYGPLRPLT